MDQIRKNARHAALLYLALALLAPFSLSYVPGILADAGGISSGTVAKHATLLRVSLASELVYQLLEIFIALALFELFRGGHRKLALQMLVLGLMPIPIVFANQLAGLGAIAIAEGQGALVTVGPDARLAAVTVLHDLHQIGLVLAGIFWGLWLFPLGRLIVRSEFLPTLLGASVTIGGMGYLVRAIAILLLPSFVSHEAVQVFIRLAEIMMLGEVPVIPGLLWLGFSKASRRAATESNGSSNVKGPA